MPIRTSMKGQAPMNAGNKIRRISCNHQPLIVLITMGMLLGLVSASSAQVLRRARRVPAEDQPGQGVWLRLRKFTVEPGSPDATTTIDGRQLPPPDPKFGGVIKENAAQSKPWWAPRVVPPKGAPTCC